MHVPFCRPARTIAGVLAVASNAACTSDGASYAMSPTPATPTKTVQALPSIAFNPAAIAVAVGDTVTFAFGSVPHDVFFDHVAGAPADIPAASTNTSVTRVFATAGRYPYTCHIHPGMAGTVVVTASSTNGGGPGY